MDAQRLQTHLARVQAQADAYRAALEQIAALGTYTAQERPYEETVARMQGEACRVLKGNA
jgi:predicted negative regulator of RcsB-dependent stress response